MENMESMEFKTEANMPFSSPFMSSMLSMVDNSYSFLKALHPGAPGTKPVSNLHRLNPGFRLSPE
jgi:hypothetical protein